MKYTNYELIKRIDSAQKNSKNLTHITDKSKLSTQDKVKLSLCKHFVQFANRKGMKLTDLADFIDIPKTRLSEITNYKITKFTVDQLLKNLSLLAAKDAEVREYLSFFEEAAELPTLKISVTKRLTRDIREAGRDGAQTAL